jgi:hypothetical protein
MLRQRTFGQDELHKVFLGFKDGGLEVSQTLRQGFESSALRDLRNAHQDCFRMDTAVAEFINGWLNFAPKAVTSVNADQLCYGVLKIQILLIQPIKSNRVPHTSGSKLLMES